MPRDLDSQFGELDRQVNFENRRSGGVSLARQWIVDIDKRRHSSPANLLAQTLSSLLTLQPGRSDLPHQRNYFFQRPFSKLNPILQAWP